MTDAGQLSAKVAGVRQIRLRVNGAHDQGSDIAHLQMRLMVEFRNQALSGRFNRHGRAQRSISRMTSETHRRLRQQVVLSFNAGGGSRVADHAVNLLSQVDPVRELTGCGKKQAKQGSSKPPCRAYC